MIACARIQVLLNPDNADAMQMVWLSSIEMEICKLTVDLLAFLKVPHQRQTKESTSLLQ